MASKKLLFGNSAGGSIDSEDPSSLSNVQSDKIIGGLNDYTFDGTNCLTIDSELLYEPDHPDWALLIDFTDGGAVDGKHAKYIFHHFYEGDVASVGTDKYGFNIQKQPSRYLNGIALHCHNNLNRIGTCDKDMSDNYRLGRAKLLILRDATRNVLDCYFNIVDSSKIYNFIKQYENTVTLRNTTNSAVKYFELGHKKASINQNPIVLGGWYAESTGGFGRFWTGTINKCVVWRDVLLTDDEIIEILTT